MKGLKAAIDTFRAAVGVARSRTTRDSSLERLECILSYRFADKQMLRKALTHKSAIPQGGRAWEESNERLEFLGDAVLNCLITEHLYNRHPDRSEGQLSKVKSLVVSRRVLAQCATSMDLGSFLILGSSERKSGGRSRRSLLANAFEAVLGAVYLDGGLEHARGLLDKHLFCRVDEFVGNEEYVNYKSALLELAQRDGFGVPCYKLMGTSGPDHAMQFTVRVEVRGVALGEGQGPNKKSAEQQAAYQATTHYSKETIVSQSKREDGDELESH
jgi:ribonuclease III